MKPKFKKKAFLCHLLLILEKKRDSVEKFFKMFLERVDAVKLDIERESVAQQYKNVFFSKNILQLNVEEDCVNLNYFSFHFIANLKI